MLYTYTVGKALYEDGYDNGIQEGREEGVLLGTLKAVQGIMKNMGVSLDKAMDTLEITGKDRDAIAKAIKG